MNRTLAIASLIGAWTIGCQFVSGVNDLEVQEDATGGSAGSGGTPNSGGSSGNGGTQGGSSGNGGTAGNGGTSGDGGSATTSTGGSAAGGTTGVGGSAGTTTTGGSGGTAGTGGECTDNPDWQCHVVSNCGCEETENCSYNASTDRTECGPIGDADPYDVCSSDADCPQGHGCIASMCKQYCITADDCGWEQAECLAIYDGDEPIEGIGYCSEACDPVDPATAVEGGIACPEDGFCYAYLDDDNEVQTTCAAPSGDGEQGDPCVDEDELPSSFLCAPGYFCDQTDLVCTRYCNPGDDSVCQGTLTCLAFGAPAEDLGYCGGCDTGEFECSTFPQCGCEAGDSCKIDNFTTGETACLAEGTVPTWGECSVQADCSPEGGSCIGGFCFPFCGETGDNTCEIGGCFQAVNTNTQEPIPGAFYCNAPCEPVLTDRAAADNVKPCPDLYQCVATSTAPTNLDTGAYCVPSEGGAVGTACERNDQCADGLGCMESVCTPYCRNSADCPDEYPSCTNLSVPLYAAEGDQVRLCYLNN